MRKMIILFLMIFVSISIQASNDTPMLAPTQFSKVKSVIGQGNAVMLEFGATSCYSCVKMGKLLYKTKAKYPNAKIYFIDIYKDMPVARSYGVRMIPTQIYLDEKGNVIDKHVGLLTPKELEARLKNAKVVRK
jgi:thioredoxin 1